MQLSIFMLTACFGGFTIFLLIFPLFSKRSDEAKRMLALVKSNRGNARRIGVWEREGGRVVSAASFLRNNLERSGRESGVNPFALAGIKDPRAPDIFFVTRICALLIGCSVAFICHNHRFIYALFAAFLLYLAPKAWLHKKGRNRRERVRKSLPDLMDLLVVSVEAGLGLEQSLIRIGREFVVSHPEMAEELERVAVERQAGSPRIETWRAFSGRMALQELTEFTSLLAETDRFGTPIARALIDFAQQLRTKRRQRAEEAAAKLKVKIIFPLVLCIFPCTFVILLGPALLNLGRSFASLTH